MVSGRWLVASADDQCEVGPRGSSRLRSTRRLGPRPGCPGNVDRTGTGLLGLLGLQIFETVGADIDDLGEEHGHRVLRVTGKGGKVVLVPLPPAVSRAVDRAAGDRTAGPPPG